METRASCAEDSLASSMSRRAKEPCTRVQMRVDLGLELFIEAPELSNDNSGARHFGTLCHCCQLRYALAWYIYIYLYLHSLLSMTQAVDMQRCQSYHLDDRTEHETCMNLRRCLTTSHKLKRNREKNSEEERREAANIQRLNHVVDHMLCMTRLPCELT